MKTCAADLHVHTALSPCAENDMTPLDIVAWAVDEGLHMIAVCDHNSARNAAAVQDAAGDFLCVLAGIEITTVEECHVLGLFPDGASAARTGAAVSATLPESEPGYEHFFGDQLLLGPVDEPRGHETRALAMASTYDVGDAVNLVHSHGGLAIAAHVDRKSFGVVSQLGFFPADAGFDAVEISRHVAPGSATEIEIAGFGLPVLHSSDAHYLDDIGAARTTLRCEEATFTELALALRNVDGRSVGGA